MTDSDENLIRNIAEQYIEEMLDKILSDCPFLGTWPRDMGAITTIVVEVLKHQYRTSEDRE